MRLLWRPASIWATGLTEIERTGLATNWDSATLTSDSLHPPPSTAQWRSGATPKASKTGVRFWTDCGCSRVGERMHRRQERGCSTGDCL
jgi:hypothetical protein